MNRSSSPSHIHIPMPELSARSSLDIALSRESALSSSRKTTSSSMSTSSKPRSILSTPSSASSRRRERARSATGDSVHFSTRASVWIIPSANDLSDAEIAALWSTDADSAASQRNVVRVIKSLRRVLDAHPEDATSDGSTAHIDARHNICTRGLEHMRSTVHLEQMRINKDCHYDAIFDEQERQEALDIYDFDEMALVSTHCSAWARERALERARGDEKFVESVREEMQCSGEWEALMPQTTTTATAATTSSTIEQELANSLRISAVLPTPSSSPSSQGQRAGEQLHLRRSCMRKSFSEKPGASTFAKQRRSLADADYQILNKSAPRCMSDGRRSSHVTVP